MYLYILLVHRSLPLSPVEAVESVEAVPDVPPRDMPNPLVTNNILLSLSRIVADFTDSVLERIKDDGSCAVDTESVRANLNGPLRTAIESFERATELAHLDKLAPDVESPAPDPDASA
jgi:hypothetical protein